MKKKLKMLLLLMILSVFIMNCHTLFHPIVIEKKKLAGINEATTQEDLIKALLLQYTYDTEYELKLIRRILDLNGKRIIVYFDDPQLKKYIQKMNLK